MLRMIAIFIYLVGYILYGIARGWTSGNYKDLCQVIEGIFWPVILLYYILSIPFIIGDKMRLFYVRIKRQRNNESKMES